MNNQVVTFINYNTNQLHLPMNLSDLIEENHIARLIDYVVENMDLSGILESYPGGGRSSYHPKMMLKITLYGYVCKVTSGRRMAKMCKENIPMMWLSGRNEPDFRTINRFRTGRLKGKIEDIFQSLVLQIVEAELVDPSNYYLDGTKIEANANKYSFVWIKSTNNYQEKLSDKVHSFLEEAAKLADEENDNDPLVSEMVNLSQLAQNILRETESKTKTQGKKKDKVIHSSENIEKIAQSLEKVEKEYEEKSYPKRRIQKARKLRRLFNEDYLPRMQKYESYKKIAAERNSFSKIDNDATFMRMKDDHMRNGQLKAGYNIQIGTNNQYILHYTIHPNPTDTRTLKAHLESLEKSTIGKPENIIADAGYGSEENYIRLEEKGINALIPYNNMRQEQKRSFSKKVKYWQNWDYNSIEDYFICPNGRFVEFKHYSKRTDKSGYVRDFKIYECEDCSGCPMKAECTTAKGNRSIHYNPVYEEMKAKVRYNLFKDESGKLLYEQRKIEPESVFGNLKGNLGFVRFVLRGNENVNIEFGLHGMAHNLIKWHRHLIKNEDNEIFKKFQSTFKFMVQKMRKVLNLFFNTLLAFFSYGSAPL